MTCFFEPCCSSCKSMHLKSAPKKGAKLLFALTCHCCRFWRISSKNHKDITLQHMQLRKSAVDWSQLLTVEVEGCFNFSDFFFVFLGLRIFTRIYCIWSETREQNLNDLLSYNGPQFLIISRFTYPNDLKQPLFLLFLLCSLLFRKEGTPSH